jgi:hypothetical protein
MGGITWPGTGDTVPLGGGGDLCPEPFVVMVLIIMIGLFGPVPTAGPLLFCVGGGFGAGIVTEGGMELLPGSRGIPVGLGPVLELACDPDELPKIAKVKNLGVSNQDFVFFDILWFGKDSIINI